MKVKLKYLKNVILLILFMLSFLGCAEKEKKAAVVEEKIPVRVMKVELKTIRNTLDYVGNIKAQDEVLVYPKVSGKIIEKIKEEGDKINKGDVIAYIDRDEVGFKFEKSPVESPLSGVIGRINVDIATSVTPQTPVALVVNMDQVKINLDITEAYLPKISVGQSAEIMVQSYTGEKFTGSVSKISPVLDLQTRTAPIEIIVVNTDHRLKSGMFAHVQLIIDEHLNVTVVMKEAVLGKAPNEYVYAVNNNIASLRNIKLGIRQADDYEVTDGLKEGDLVVIMGQQRLREGIGVFVEQGNGDDQ